MGTEVSFGRMRRFPRPLVETRGRLKSRAHRKSAARGLFSGNRGFGIGAAPDYVALHEL